MKISKMFVQKYGSLTNLYIPKDSSLTDGLNVIFGPNEAGKSQLKAFAEQVLFPKISVRSKVAQRPVGTISFVHDGYSYHLESAIRTNKVYRELRRGDEAVSGGMADLFPGLHVEGNEVFSNLYSFGLDELLLSTTLGQRALSEHLFGAVAGGNSISISSVLDSLDDRIKKLVGGVSHGRNLEVILNDIIEKDRVINAQISIQHEFATRYKAREELAKSFDRAESLVKAKRRERELLEQVEDRRDQFLEYEASRQFLEAHASLEALTPRLSEKIQSGYFQLKRSAASIADLESKLLSCQGKIDISHGALSSLSFIKIQVASGILGDVVSMGEDIDARKEEYEKEVAAFDAGAAQFDEELVRRIRQDAESNKDLRPEIDSLLDLRSDIHNLETQMASDFGTREAYDRSGIETEFSKISDALVECKALLLKIGSGPSSTGNIKGIWPFAIVPLIPLAVGIASVVGVLGRRVAVPALLFGMALAIMFIGIVIFKRSNSVGFQDSEVKDALSSLGVESLDAFRISSKVSELEDRKVFLSNLLQIDNQHNRISGILADYGLNSDSSSSLDSAKRYVSALVNLLKQAEALRSANASIAIATKALSNRKFDLVSCLKELSDDSELADEVSVDFLKALVAGLVRRAELDVDHRAQIRAIEAEIKGYEEALFRENQLFQGIKESLIEDLGILNLSFEELSDELISLLTNYEQNKSVVTNFERIIHSQFQDLADEAMLSFERSSPDVNQALEDLKLDIGLLNDEIKTIRTQEAEITLEETRLSRVNPIIDVEEVRESLLLEAEDSIKELKYLVLARELLNNANSRFEEIHQPELLKLSSEIFSRITQSRYSSIIKREDGPREAVFVRNANGKEVMDIDLSRGTREQLYISIRLALVSRPDSIDLPLLMDDVMVNADVQRARGLASELVKVSSNRQIIYFCAKADTMKLFASVGGDVNLIELAQL